MIAARRAAKALKEQGKSKAHNMSLKQVPTRLAAYAHAAQRVQEKREEREQKRAARESARAAAEQMKAFKESQKAVKLDRH